MVATGDRELTAAAGATSSYRVSADVTMLMWALQSPTPSPTPSVLRAPPPDPIQTVGAIVAIVFALAAGILGYRIIRGGRGL